MVIRVVKFYLSMERSSTVSETCRAAAVFVIAPRFTPYSAMPLPTPPRAILLVIPSFPIGKIVPQADHFRPIAPSLSPRFILDNRFYPLHRCVRPDEIRTLRSREDRYRTRSEQGRGFRWSARLLAPTHWCSIKRRSTDDAEILLSKTP